MRPLSRRFKFAAVVLVVLIGGAWWLSRPAIDPRLVGTWQWYAAKGDLRNTTPQHIAVITFNGDGTGVRTSDPSDAAPHRRFPILWSVDSAGRLFFDNWSDAVTRFHDKSMSIYARIVGRFDPQDFYRWEIRELKPDRVVLESVSTPQAYIVLKRASPADSVR
jgi:hypothetical protein